MIDSIETVKNSLNNYTLKSELSTTNSNLDSLTSIVKNNTNNISNVQSIILENSKVKSYNYVYNTTTIADGTAIIQVKNGILYFYLAVALKDSLEAWGTVNIGTIENWDLGYRGNLIIVNTLGGSSSTLSVQVDQSGNVILLNHGNVATGGSSWYIGRSSIQIS